MAYCTFGMLEIRTLTPSRFKDQCSDTLNILGRSCNYQQGFVKQRTLSLSITVVLNLNFLKTFIKIAILGRLYQCNSCYTKVGQHWIKYLCVHSSFIIYLFDLEKLALSISVGFHKYSLIVTCCTFGRFKFRTVTPSRFKNQINETFKPLVHNCNHQ